jgi:hypothetical protein
MALVLELESQLRWPLELDDAFPDSGRDSFDVGVYIGGLLD